MKIYKQETSKSCGVACLRSIINHYGNNFSEKDIWNKHVSFQSKTGILNPILCLGVTALKFGFNATYIGYNPIITNKNKYPDLEKSLKAKSKNYFDYGKSIIDNALEFLKLGGKIKIDKLNIEKIKKLIDKNNFILVEVKPAFVNKKASINFNHKVIVTGYNKKGFKILNPSDAKEYLGDFDSFLLAFYAAVPELLIIKP
ncbi:MAG: cysteine peptidase family C39 domain-containing protein [Candidatus Pacearchaeota archaeon]|jgi:ABC-type bacteriocin/lantibiotic exporter with double-glycine peptidase domain